MYGAHTLQVYPGDMMWADGTSTIIPPIIRARSGWWYKPDVAITDGRKTFGMGRDGEEKAQAWHEDRFEAAILKHPGEQPIKIGLPLTEPRFTTGSSDLWASYQHPVYGHVTLEFQIASPTYYQKNFTIAYTLTYHRFIDLLTGHNAAGRDSLRPTNPWAEREANRAARHEVEPEALESAIKKFKQAPWTTVARKLQVTEDETRIFQPPEQLIAPHRLKFTNEIQSDGGVDFQMHSKINRYLGQEVRKTVRASMDALKELGEVLKYFGAEVSVMTSYLGSGEATVTGVEFKVKADDKVGNEEGHTIIIGESGVRVTCGYVRQEQRYQQYEKEKARKLLQEFAQDEYEPFEF